jgi:hypothetical protein
VRRELVTGSVAGEEGDAPSVELPEVERTARRAVGRVDDDLLDVVEERVEPGPAEDADVGPGRAGHPVPAAQAVLAVEPDPDFESEPDFFDPESDFDPEPESEDGDELELDESEPDDSFAGSLVAVLEPPRLSVR